MTSKINCRWTPSKGFHAFPRRYAAGKAGRLRTLLLALCLVLPSVGSLLASCGGSSGAGDGGDIITPPGQGGGTVPPGEGGGIVPTQGGGGIVSEGGVGAGGLLGGAGGLLGGAGGAPGGAGGGTVMACGEPGTACCNGTGCNNGGCCVSGICMAVGGMCVGLGGGTCGNGACGTCGGVGLPCCTASTGSVCTAPETRCSSGTCAKCGDLGSPCCANPAGGTGTCKGPTALCSNDVCIACGMPGEACCPGSQCASGCCYNNTCLGEGTACGSNGGNCQAGRCSGCGSATQICCSNLCYDGLLCKSGTCTACGGSGQICCPTGTAPSACQSGMACTSTASDGVCARCGGLGDICCAGNQCSADGCCSAGRCVAISTGACSTGGVPGTGGTTGAGGVTGSGGKTGSGGITSSGGVPGTGGTTATGCGALIDDMESGTGNICKTTGRQGMWYTYVDSDTYSSISPLPESSVLPELLSTPRTTTTGTSTRAMHISGYYSTYAGLAVWLNIAARGSIPGTFNGGSYAGIKFYAKGKGSLIVVGQMPATERDIYGGTCPYTECAGNQYPVGTLSSSWTQYTVPFTYLQDGTVEPFDPTKIWSLEFMFYSYTPLYGASFDLWVDDLTFY